MDKNISVNAHYEVLKEAMESNKESGSLFNVFQTFEVKCTFSFLKDCREQQSIGYSFLHLHNRYPTPQ